MSNSNNSAKFAFFYVLSLVTLIFTALATGMIIFQVINKKVVDILTYAPGGFSQGTLKFGKLDRESGVRKWLTYFILLVSAVVMIGWLIGTLNSFLNGELTTKFILKSLTAILISAAIFSYYLYDIRRKEINKNNNIIRGYYYGDMAIALAALIAGFFFIDSPAQVRQQKFDQNIINRFSQIDNAINAYYGENKKLPTDLNALINGGSTYYILQSDITDPATGKAFDYKVSAKDAYELCATFRTANRAMAEEKSYYVDTRWLHDSGYQCLKQRVVLLDNNAKPLPASVPVR
jgi:type II secretory pathway pseudopilin PulG